MNRMCAARSGLLLLCAAALSLPLAACERERATERQIKERVAIALRDGAASGMTVIDAREIDPETLELIDVRIEDGQRILAADRAEILVDPVENTVSLRLEGVVGADTEGGVLRPLPSMTTRAFRLQEQVVRGAGGE